SQCPTRSVRAAEGDAGLAGTKPPMLSDDGRRSSCRHNGGLRREVGYRGRPVEIHVDRESESLGCIDRENGNRPGCVGEHAKRKCAARGSLPGGALKTCTAAGTT